MTLYKDIRIQVTHGCNLNCIYCFAESNKPLTNELKVKELKDYLDIIMDQIKIVSFTGGEPLLRKSFVYNVNAYLKSNRKETRLFTNGVLLDEEVLAQRFDVIMVSLDDSRAGTNDFLRSRGAYKKAIKALELSVKLDYGHETWVRTTVTSMNIDHIEKILRYVQDLGVNRWVARPLIGYGRGRGNKFMISRSEWHQLAEKIKQMESDFKIKLTLNPFCKPGQPDDYPDKSCPDLLITPIGELKRCAYSQIFGNIYNSAKSSQKNLD